MIEKPWMTTNNFINGDIKKRKMTVIFGTSIIFLLIMSVNLVMLISDENVIGVAI